MVNATPLAPLAFGTLLAVLQAIWIKQGYIPLTGRFWVISRKKNETLFWVIIIFSFVVALTFILMGIAWHLGWIFSSQ